MLFRKALLGNAGIKKSKTTQHLKQAQAARINKSKLQFAINTRAFMAFSVPISLCTKANNPKKTKLQPNLTKKFQEGI